MVHTFNCHGPLIFANNSSKEQVSETKAAVSEKEWFSSEAICKWASQGQLLMCGEKDHMVREA